jgi:hypothetical protein
MISPSPARPRSSRAGVHFVPLSIVVVMMVVVVVVSMAPPHDDHGPPRITMVVMMMVVSLRELDVGLGRRLRRVLVDNPE